MKRSAGLKVFFAVSLLVALVAGFVGGRALMTVMNGEPKEADPALSSEGVGETEPPPPGDTPKPTPIATTTPPSPPPTPTPSRELPEITGGVLEGMQQELDSYFAGINLNPNSKWVVCVMDVETGARALSRDTNAGDDPSLAASLIKLFIAGAVYGEAQERARVSGETPEDELLALSVNAAGDLMMMLRDSDNQSANRLVEAIGGGDFAAGMAKVTAFAKSIGCDDTSMNRRLLDPPDNGENYTSAADCARALLLIARGEFVSGEASKQIYEWLRADSSNANKNSKIRAGITDPEAEIANKTGELPEPTLAEHDAAIVTTPGARYVLCIMSKPTDGTKVPEAKQMLGMIAGRVHEYMNNG